MKSSLFYTMLLFIIAFILHIVFYNFLFVDTLYFLAMDNTEIIYNLSFNINNSDAIQSINNATELNNNDSLNCYSSFKTGVKSRLFWITWERYKDKYNSFEEFKKVWDPNTKIHKVIRNDIINEFEGLAQTKRIISWIMSRRNPNNAREYKRPKNFTPVFTDISNVFKK